MEMRRGGGAEACGGSEPRREDQFVTRFRADLAEPRQRAGDGLGAFDRGDLELAEDAGLALGEIEKVSHDLADLIQSISAAASQQSAAATNISATMNVIQEITTQTSAGASQTAESIGNLAQLAADLRRSVADFKLPA